eukprot:COSAG05_NODE_904_length_6658_cov_17.747065_3_plen_75_part_00
MMMIIIIIINNGGGSGGGIARRTELKCPKVFPFNNPREEPSDNFERPGAIADQLIEARGTHIGQFSAHTRMCWY